MRRPVSFEHTIPAGSTLLVAGLHAVWGLPQNGLGLLLFLMIRSIDRHSWTRVTPLGTLTTRTRVLGGGISLGCFLFSTSRTMDRHEWGHSVQSLCLGPLYLPVVGLPSVVRATRAKAARRRGHPFPGGWYYAGFPEAWADRIAGIERGTRARGGGE